MKVIVRARRGLPRLWRQLRPVRLDVPLTVILTGSAGHQEIRETYNSIARQTMRPHRVFVPPGSSGARHLRTPDTVVESLGAVDIPPLVALGAVLRAGADVSSGVVVASTGVRYPANWLAGLYNESLVYPMAIIAGGCLAIMLGPDGRLTAPQSWPACSDADSRMDVMPVSSSGVFYPRVWIDTLATSGQSISLGEIDLAWHDLWARGLSLAEQIPVRCLPARSGTHDGTKLPAGHPPEQVAQALERSLR